MACLNTCVIDESFGPGCVPEVSGNNVTIYLASKCNIASFTATGSGMITNITMNGTPAEVFHTAIVELDSLVVNENGTFPQKNYTQEITFRLSNVSDNIDVATAYQEASNFIDSMVKNSQGIVVIVENNAGIRKVYGTTTGLFPTALARTSGAAPGDIPGSTITLSRPQSTLAPVLSAAFTIPT